MHTQAEIADALRLTTIFDCARRGEDEEAEQQLAAVLAKLLAPAEPCPAATPDADPWPHHWTADGMGVWTFFGPHSRLPSYVAPWLDTMGGVFESENALQVAYASARRCDAHGNPLTPEPGKAAEVAPPPPADDIGRRYAERAVEVDGNRVSVGRDLLCTGGDSVDDRRRNARQIVAAIVNAAVAEATADRDRTIDSLHATIGYLRAGGGTTSGSQGSCPPSPAAGSCR